MVGEWRGFEVDQRKLELKWYQEFLEVLTNVYVRVRGMHTYDIKMVMTMHSSLLYYPC